ncbi:DNA polymerase III subunit gamma/tau [Pectinatus brassicae]|uniref:DNA-directed DNA polymerase n=1 Tax=Pectinatus brassicae TaxID=862415 RepID=A0A840UEM4_9FIRM|nr:DNA polymerase III subunit gamma/tau [Pectinatus brassicae]MBB5335479.1 DNA polymerase-3 subunit gamma/tau [Pectinatus brassicae]
MAYVALYRKWRPKDFADLVGQDHISHTLAQAIKTGKIGHAYLFSGPRGTGKTSTAKILAKALNCEHGPTAKPCNKCSNCSKINNNTFMDVYEIDAASNRGIDEIRDLRETVKYAPVDGKYKVYIIDEVHMLTSEAFNALLKTLEEPPSNVVFILATTEVHKVPTTIQSRCQRYDFKRITKKDIQKQLEKITSSIGVVCEDEALETIAVHADGGMRDALSLLDQCTAQSDEKLTKEKVTEILGIIAHESLWKITDAIAAHDIQSILQEIADILNTGKSISQLLTELSWHWRSLMVYKAAQTLTLDMYKEDFAVIKRQSDSFTHEQLTTMIKTVYEALGQTRWSPQPRVTVEMALMKLCYPYENREATVPTNEKINMLEAKIMHLEKLLSNIGQQAANAPVMQTKISVKATGPGQVENVKKSLPLEAAESLLPDIKVQKNTETASLVQPAIDITDADASSIWQVALRELKMQHKIPALACVEKAQPRSLQNGQLVLAFKASFLKARTERDDYRNLLEGILFEKTGQTIRLVCIMDESAGAKSSEKAPAKQTKTATVPVDKTKIIVADDDLNEEEQKRLKNAVNIFGNNIVNEDKETDK